MAATWNAVPDFVQPLGPPRMSTTCIDRSNVASLGDPKHPSKGQPIPVEAGLFHVKHDRPHMRRQCQHVPIRLAANTPRFSPRLYTQHPRSDFD
jgi:hypothetical protein